MVSRHIRYRLQAAATVSHVWDAVLRDMDRESHSNNFSQPNVVDCRMHAPVNNEEITTPSLVLRQSHVLSQAHTDTRTRTHKYTQRSPIGVALGVATRIVYYRMGGSVTSLNVSYILTRTHIHIHTRIVTWSIFYRRQILNMGMDVLVRRDCAHTIGKTDGKGAQIARLRTQRHRGLN